MLEAVNSIISNAPLLRGNAEQVAASRSFAANPERVQEVVQAPYVSPYIHVDLDYNRAVLQLRDGETGDVEEQFPSEERLAQLREAEIRRQIAKTQSLLGGDTGEPAPKASVAPQKTTAPKAGSFEVKTASRAPATPQQIAAFEAGAQTAQTTSDRTTVSVTA